jgi:hypothetical protein
MCKCIECGSQFTKVRAHEQLFCSSACRTSHANRRKLRGADMYDLFMTMRYDRANSKGVWAVMCRMAQDWNAEDVEAGRKSFMPARKVLERHVQHVATKHNINRRARK